LFFAKKNNNDETVQLLLENGAINTKDGRISKNQSRVKKAKKSKKKVAKKFHKLQYTTPEGKKIILTVSEFKTLFADKYPDLVKYFENPDLLNEKSETLD
jgi:hypothetical protein